MNVNIRKNSEEILISLIPWLKRYLTSDSGCSRASQRCRKFLMGLGTADYAVGTLKNRFLG
jgi:hypothetical protein